MKTWKQLKFRNKPWAALSGSRVVIPKATIEPDVLTVAALQDAKERLKNVPLPTYHIVYPTPIKVTQAERVLAKFGGALRLADALKRVGRARNSASIYKWLYPYPKGRGGLIPTSAWVDILTAAKHEGIILRPEDMMPSFENCEPIEVEETTYPRLHGATRLFKQIKAGGRLPRSSKRRMKNLEQIKLKPIAKGASHVKR